VSIIPSEEILSLDILPAGIPSLEGFNEAASSNPKMPLAELVKQFGLELVAVRIGANARLLPPKDCGFKPCGEFIVTPDDLTWRDEFDGGFRLRFRIDPIAKFKAISACSNDDGAPWMIFYDYSVGSNTTDGSANDGWIAFLRKVN